ncbi:MAG: right-handed parallel beta-helix repeat-containing protein [Spirochaetales bacterium]|nr:right-handed parallel beta-helix repeat-containing protein [Spirochaetales bacterium]
MKITALSAALVLLLFSCSVDTVYNPENSGYDNFTEEPPHVFTERHNDGIADDDIFYVAVDGDDEAAGSIDAPWQTIQAGVNRIGPGQKLYVRGGVYPETVWVGHSGRENSPLIISAYPGEEAILDGTGIPRLADDQFWGMISATAQEYITIRGFKIRNAHMAGITVDNTDHVVIEDILTYNTLGSGIISYWGDDISIEYNEIILACNLNMWDGPDYPERIACIQECLTAAGADGFSVAFNHVHHNGYPIAFGGEGIDAKHGSAHGRIYRNTVNDLNKLGIYVDSYAYTHDIDVEANSVSRCWQWGICVAAEDEQLTEDIRVFNNIVFDNDRVGIGVENWGLDVIHRVKDIHIFNNTLFNNHPQPGQDPWGCGIHIDAPDSENIYIYNNLIAFNLNRQLDVLGFSESDPTPLNLIIDNNLVFYDPETDEYTTPGDHPINADPLFADFDARDGRLLPGSPALNSADTSRLRPQYDFYGNPRPAAGPYAIGAVEEE